MVKERKKKEEKEEKEKRRAVQTTNTRFRSTEAAPVKQEESKLI